ncbi:MAG: transporter substrate-binding domain-containing protein [Gammaproteobacteria bacterium]|nr:MAG: transporter substrate-binding domain-containing protein [Gammaproteobacteria bacterium]
MFNSQKIFRFISLVSVGAALSWANCYSNAQTASITLPFSTQHSSENPNYYYEEALKLALEKTEKSYSKLDIKFYPYALNNERQYANVKTNGGLDVIWSSSSRLREQQLIAVKFNLLRELSDYKVLLIRKADKENFAKINSVADLRQFKAGVVAQSQDTQILQRNSISITTAWDYDSMFKMLADKRFDYVIRGAQEIWPEVEQHKDENLIAEEKLLIGYKNPVYFFVNPKNEKLAKRIKAGLDIAEKDGSLQRLTLSLPAFKKGADEIRNKKRRLISLDAEDY